MNNNELFSLEGKTALVTGAAGLLGQSHCRALVAAGAEVVGTDIDEAACRTVREKVPGIAFAQAADVADPDSLNHLNEVILSRCKGVDVLVNNAAINDMYENPSALLELSKFEKYPLEMWQRSIDVNITGVFLCCQVIGAEMARRGSGSIINVASTYGVVAPDQSLYLDRTGRRRFYKSPVYPVTKGAVISFTRFLAAYWGEKGVRVNSLSPGGVENGQDDFFVSQYAARTPLRRMASRDDYMGALVFLASDASSYMTGANLVVDGGYTIW